MNRKKVNMGLFDAAVKALSVAEELIRSEYEGTVAYDTMMRDLNPVRDAINRATVEGVTPQDVVAPKLVTIPQEDRPSRRIRVGGQFG